MGWFNDPPGTGRSNAGWSAPPKADLPEKSKAEPPPAETAVQRTTVPAGGWQNPYLTE